MSRIVVLIHGEKEISFISIFQIFSKNSFSTSAQLRINTKDSSEAWRKQSSGVFFTNPHGDAGSTESYRPPLSSLQAERMESGKGMSWQARKSYLKYSFSAPISDISQLDWLLSWAIKQKDRGWFDAEE